MLWRICTTCRCVFTVEGTSHLLLIQPQPSMLHRHGTQVGHQLARAVHQPQSCCRCGLRARKQAGPESTRHAKMHMHNHSIIITITIAAAAAFADVSGCV
jgi:hypothetical protein